MGADAAAVFVPDRDWVARVARALEAQGHGPVECRQTHLSWLLIGREQVWKLHRPVRLPFVDFTSAAARRRDLEDELRLNLRLAPSLYRRVLPIAGSPDAPQPDAAGPAHDHALLMRRFPDGALLSERLAAGRLDASTLAALAARVVAFHREAPVAPDDRDWGRAGPTIAAVEQVAASLAAQAPGWDEPTRQRWQRVQAWLRETLPSMAPWIDARRAAGAVREGHGDLHLANAVVLDDGPPPQVTAFDCLEFDPALRWIDRVADIAFLSMDLQAHGRRDLAHGFLDAWLEASGDVEGVRLLRLYSVYRALVRWMVAGLPGAAASAPGADYPACADALVTDAGGARLLITCGRSGSGKSTLAAQLLREAGALRLRSDVERKRLHGLGPLDSSAGRGLDLYGAEATRRTFERLRAGARAALAAGYPVILDAAFLRRDERDRCRALARELGVPWTVLVCDAPTAVLRERVAQRQVRGGDASEAGPAALEQQLALGPLLDADEAAEAWWLDISAAVDVAALAARWRAVR